MFSVRIGGGGKEVMEREETFQTRFRKRKFSERNLEVESRVSCFIRCLNCEKLMLQKRCGKGNIYLVNVNEVKSSRK